jgi:predicted metal-dependent phosphoesterase TrpH
MKFDLHLHTTRHSPDSLMAPFAMIRRAQALGLHGVVITEHDWLWTESELDELRRAAPDLILLAGIEVSAKQGHFLAYGVHDPFAVPRGIDVTQLCHEVHRQGGAVVAAHPFRWGQPFAAILRDSRPVLDGLEIMTNNMDAECRRQAARIQGEYSLTGLGSSDAHEEAILGICYTEFASTIRDQRDLIEAIRSKQATACERVTPPAPPHA